MEGKITPWLALCRGQKGSKHRDREREREKKRSDVEVDFIGGVTADEDTLLINLLIKKKNEQRVSAEA